MAKIKNKQELISKIKNAEGFSNEEKSQMLALLNENKIYGLVWEKSTEDAWEMMKDYVPVLKEDESKRIDHGSENPNHILIEGDNLNALTALSYTHEGKIDVIYIDPPYNTGNKDFIYNDIFIDRDDEFRHSQWISFIQRRLKIAKKLLKDDGTIWISIDENELFNLKMICDSIFSENNFRSLITVIANPGGRDYGGIAKQTEYILVYGRSECSEIQKVPDASHVFDMKDEWGPFELRELRNRNTKFNDGNRPNLCYPFYVNPNSIDEHGLYSIALEPDEHYSIKVMPLKSRGIQTVWRWGKEEKSRMNLNINIKGKLKNDGTFMIVEKYRDESVMIKNVWLDKKFRTEQGSLQIKAIIGEGKFDYPKPLEIPHLILNTSKNKETVVLDFFAGSGTTLHATMQLNAEDGGHRQCILVTNNENNICEEVTYERNKRVIEGYTTPKGELVEGLKDNNLRYFKVDFATREKTHQQNKELFRLLKDIICIKDDVYREQHQFGSLSLAGKEKLLQFFAENGKQVLMVYDARVIPYLVNEIEKMDITDSPIMIDVFADGAYPYTADFTNVLKKVKLIPMPYAFLRGIKDSLPEEPSSWVDNSELTDDEKAKLMEEAIKAENNEQN